MNLSEEAVLWEDNEACAQGVVDRFTMCVNRNPVFPGLKEHRDFVEKHGYGFGERAFHWLWKLIVDEMPQDFRFLEVGVYKGQVLSLVRLLADKANKRGDIKGVSLLSSFAGDTGKFKAFPDEDYRQHIKDLHDHFDQTHPTIITGDSTSPAVHAVMKMQKPFDVVYVDGCHEYEYVVNDLQFYPTLLRPGGLLVVDDSGCNLKQPQGFFRGILDVTKAVNTVIEIDPGYEHLLAVMHNRVWRKL